MTLRIDILTLFEGMFDGFRRLGLIGRAVRSGILEVHLTDIRRFAKDSYGSVDDAPFGGGPGMVLMCQPVFDAVEFVRPQLEYPGKVILLSPQGRRLNQEIVTELAGEKRLILLAGHYEGFDERIRTALADDEISVGDFVMSGGEFAAMALSDAVARLLPGATGKAQSVKDESFTQGLLEYPQYTRPRVFRGMSVPDVLLSGNHAEIEKWRKEQAEMRTKNRRGDLWKKYTRKTASNNTAGESAGKISNGEQP